MSDHKFVSKKPPWFKAIQFNAKNDVTTLKEFGIPIRDSLTEVNAVFFVDDRTQNYIRVGFTDWILMNVKTPHEFVVVDNYTFEKEYETDSRIY